MSESSTSNRPCPTCGRKAGAVYTEDMLRDALTELFRLDEDQQDCFLDHLKGFFLA